MGKKAKDLNNDQRKKHRIVNKLSMRRARQRMSEEDLEERRRKDRERYQRKKEQGLVKHIADVTPRERRIIRKNWKQASKRYRQKKKYNRALEIQTDNMIAETPPASPSASTSQSSRALSGQRRAKANRRLLKQENLTLKLKLKLIESRVAKYKTRLHRSQMKLQGLLAKTTSEKYNSVAALKRKAVESFLENDACSKITAGKKETITRKRQKKQIRFLLDNLYNLYKKFIDEVEMKMSYSLFCKYRPFWILIPNVNKRDTCLCAVHTNAESVVRSLKFGKVIEQSSIMALVKSICCTGKLQEDCLVRKCEKCKDLKVKFNDCNPNDTIVYEKWVTKKISCIIKGKNKVVSKTMKENITTQKRVLCQVLLDLLPNFMNHINNVFHQYRAINRIKNQVTDDWALLHLDFSENYNCKYGEEVQSAHFGGSKPQITLHTSVLYYYDNVLEILSVNPFCTISENMRHDPVLICAHLLPILETIKLKVPNLKTMHFTSDGPVTQYRNKSMFFLISHFIAVKLYVENVVWHYSEAGHGKGAPDGVGGCVKRTADQAVALGKDVSSFESLLNCLKERCKGINILPIDDSQIGNIEDLLKLSSCKAFKGTLNIHQVVWDRQNPSFLNANRLSCWVCSPKTVCKHYGLGVINVEKNIQELSTPSVISEYDCDVTPRSTIANISDDCNMSPTSPNVSRNDDVNRNDDFDMPNIPSIGDRNGNDDDDDSPQLFEINRKRHSFYRSCYRSSTSSSPDTQSYTQTSHNLPKPKTKLNFFSDTSDEE